MAGDRSFIADGLYERRPVITRNSREYNVREAMTINWQVLLTTLGGGTAILAAAAWLIRTALNHALTRDAEEFKARLSADADIEVERLKSSLQTAALEHQIRFSNLHLKRAEVIAEIYTQMVDAEQYGQRFAFVEGYEEGSKRLEAYLEIQKKLVEFYFFVEKRRIYLPEHICALLKAFLDSVRKNVIAINTYAHIDQPSNPPLLQEKNRVVMEVYEAFEGSIPAARAALEKEFRQLLGVEQDTKGD